MSSKLVRTITSILPVEEGRTGSCNGCGACCRLPVKCPFLVSKDNETFRCAIYRIRPPNCRKFPRTPSQLKLVEDVCSYSFSEDGLRDDLGKPVSFSSSG